MRVYPDRQKGFTLIELSIVLVIIGLIIGGILTGQDLINSATIRAQLSQVEKYNTAVRTFQGKYGGLPGDMLSGSASAFGLAYMNNCATSVYYGNGDGILEGGAVGSTNLQGEPLVFWRQLSNASLIDNYNSSGVLTSDCGRVNTGTIPGSTLLTYTPSAKLGAGNFVAVASDNASNFFILSGFNTATSMLGSGVLTGGVNAITPLQAYNMDAKADDGLPASGSMLAIDATTALFGSSTTPLMSVSTLTSCVNVTPNPTSYALGNNAVACSLRFRFN